MSALVWAVTLIAMIAVLLADLFIIGRRPHEPSVRESSLWVGFYVGLALLFGVVLWLTAGAASQASSTRAGSPSTASRWTTSSSS